MKSEYGIPDNISVIISLIVAPFHPGFTSSKEATQTLEQCVRPVQSWQ